MAVGAAYFLDEESSFKKSSAANKVEGESKQEQVPFSWLTKPLALAGLLAPNQVSVVLWAPH